MKNLLASIAVLSAVLMGSAPASADTLDEIKARGKVLIGVTTTVPPYGSLDANMKPEGYDIDMANMIARDLGVELQLVEVTGPNRIAYLLSKQVDMVVAVFGVTPERAQSINFTIPYGSNQIWVYGRKDQDIPDTEALTGKSVAVVRGTIQDGALTRVASEGTTIRRYEDDAIAAGAFLSGQVDALVTGTQIGKSVLERDNDRSEAKTLLGVSPYSIGLRKGEPDFLHMVNTFVYSYRMSGELDQLAKKWIGGESVPLPSF